MEICAPRRSATAEREAAGHRPALSNFFHLLSLRCPGPDVLARGLRRRAGGRWCTRRGQDEPHERANQRACSGCLEQWGEAGVWPLAPAIRFRYGAPPLRSLWLPGADRACGPSRTWRSPGRGPRCARRRPGHCYTVGRGNRRLCAMGQPPGARAAVPG